MLTTLIITSFRGIYNQRFLLWKKTHIVGRNGSWKTHVLDAIHLLTGAKNIYGNTKLENSDRIEGVFWDDFQPKSYVLLADEKRENFYIQNKKFTKPKYHEALSFRTVYVSPFDMNILYFAPGVRRDYLDDILSRAYGQFNSVRRDFEQIMKQRNALLKKIRDAEATEEMLDFWDKKFAEIAVHYGLYRKKYCEFIQEKIPLFPDFFGNYQVQFVYQSDWIYAENPENFIREFLCQNRQRDIFSGHTHIGPHRDDFTLEMKNSHGETHSVQFFLSRWEMKMLLLWLKIIECDFIEKQTQKNVILLVDDIFAELDESNIIIFLNIIIQHQIILTSQKPLPDGINSEIFTCINLTNS